MKEDFLHFLWRYQKFEKTNLITTNGASVSIITTGTYNSDSGPDFFNAKASIGEQLWAGNVEIHLKSSDWYVHHHEKDPAYDNVILHVVWENDMAVYRSNHLIMDTLELKNYVSEKLLEKFKQLYHKKKKFINCEYAIKSIKQVIHTSWLERLFVERLEAKNKLIYNELIKTNYDWEAVLFRLLCKNFGLKVNGESFYDMATHINFKIVKKLYKNPFALEALFFGISGMLMPSEIPGMYYKGLKEEFSFLQKKYNQQLAMASITPKFFRLRPNNFPTIRLSQLAQLYASHQNLFSVFVRAKSKKDFDFLRDVAASSFWDTHYTFESSSVLKPKRLHEKFIELLIINTIIPLQFSYAKYTGMVVTNESFFKLLREIPSEKNIIIDTFKEFGINASSSLDSQGLLQMHNKYCMKHRCLQCAIGNSILMD